MQCTILQILHKNQGIGRSRSKFKRVKLEENCIDGRRFSVGIRIGTIVGPVGLLPVAKIGKS